MRFAFSILLFSFCLILSAQQSKSVVAKKLLVDTSKFVLVEGGSFNMGTDTPVELHETPVHVVNLRSFYMSKTEVTFHDYDKFCKATTRDTVTSRGFGRGKHPAITVSWLDAVAYCNWLSATEKLSMCYWMDSAGVHYSDTAKGYRLPTEAEWEYAARGANKSKNTRYSGSVKTDEIAWYNFNSSGCTHEVGQKQPNEIGLFDMNGNVWEWVWDWYDGSYYSYSGTDNPSGPDKGNYRVMRGGAFYNNSSYCNVYTRQNSYPNFMQNSVGFRIARTKF